MYFGQCTEVSSFVSLISLLLFQTLYWWGRQIAVGVWQFPVVMLK